MKLDRSFIEGVPHRRVDVAIVRALSTLAKSLDIHLIAEGVVYGQGFLFERPMSPEQIEERLTTGGASISPEWTGLR